MAPRGYVLSRAAGVRTPALIAYDDACDLLPVPYLIVERVKGRALSQLDLEGSETPDIWREVGRDLARLHTGAGPPAPVAQSPTYRPAPAQTVTRDRTVGAHPRRWLHGA